MRLAVRILLVLSLVLVCAVAPALADVPAKMSVQGRLTSAGVAVPAGLKSFTFKIFDQQIGGIEIWPAGDGETQILTTDANGLWTGSVGEIIPLTPAVFQEPVRWLEVTVYDGVTTETLPRMELKTNPFTYRAATSQHADSLGNATYTDLTNQFVDATGDVMTGPLANNWTQNNTGTSIQITNLSDGFYGLWNTTSGTWGLSSDVTGDNNYWNIGIAASARGNNNQYEANRGIYAYADGEGTWNIGVDGTTGLSGTANYSGYFHNGDFLIDNTQTPGTGGVLLPPDAIDATEILDEPGLSNGLGSVSVPISATFSDMAVTTITIPTDGYIFLVGSMGLETHNNTDVGYGYAQIDETEGGINEPGWVAVGFATFPNTGYFDWSMTVQKTYFKPAGTYTFRLESEESFSSDGMTNAYNPTITAIFIPTSYASVTGLVSAQEAGAFEKSEPVAASNVGPQAAGATAGGAPAAYQVDLRELELKAARTAAEAEKARRELVEAKAGAAIRSREESHR